MNFPQAIIHCDALRHNLHQVRRLAPHSRIMAVVKADGYGHGLEEVVAALAEADALAVARLGEALVLRQAGYQGAVVVLGGFTDTEELRLAAAYDLTLVVHEIAQLSLLQQAALAAPISVWLKVDTGMHRLGFPVDGVVEILAHLCRCRAVAAVVGFMTHLANADRVEDRVLTSQLEIFRKVPAVGLPRSMANSAAILACPQAHFEWVRPGLMLYGVSPFSNRLAAVLGLKPAMTLATRLIAVHHRHAGDGVGYGAAWTCPENMVIGVAALGYGDGYPWHAGSGTPVLVNGKPVPLVGRVSMDMITVDLRSQPEAKVGDPVVAWGPGLPVERVAAHATTIPYELLSQVTARVLRRGA